MAVTPDSSRVVYTATPADGASSALFSVPVAGPASAAVRLAANVTHSAVKVSPDSRMVVFHPNGGPALRVVPTAGPASAAARLTAPAVDGGDPGAFAINANSRSVVYLSGGPRELYRVPLTLAPDPEPPTTKLNGPLAPNGAVRSFRLAPNGTDVVYLADQDGPTAELYRVRLGGAGRVKVSAPLPPGWLVRDASSRVVYSEVDDATGLLTLFTVPPAGPRFRRVLLSFPVAIAPIYDISPDGSRTLHVEDFGPEPPVLLSVATQAVPLPSEPGLPETAVISGAEGSGSFRFSRNGTRVLYRGRPPGQGAHVFGAAVDGTGDPVNLSGPLGAPAGASVDFVGAGNRAVYSIQPDAADHVDLYSSRIP